MLLWVPLSPGSHRLGGSALAQCYSQLGDRSPDLDQPQLLTACFNATQTLLHGQQARRHRKQEKKKKSPSADKLFLGFTFTVDLMWDCEALHCEMYRVALKHPIFKKLHIQIHCYHIMSLRPDTELSRKVERLSSPHGGHKICPDMKVRNVLCTPNECQKVKRRAE